MIIVVIIFYLYDKGSIMLVKNSLFIQTTQGGI